LEKSDKSYGTAVALCGVFGVLGIHHFYLGNVLMGIFDLGMFITFLVLYTSGYPVAAFGALLVDALHTVFVFYRLITEQETDGQGRPVLIK
jgi:TM2 domain-containing membrane protein YozV